jgi:hypothetical protein
MSGSTSKPRSQNEEAREANKDFWEGYERPRKAAAESPGDEEEGRDAASEGEGRGATDDTDEGEGRGPPPTPATMTIPGTTPPRPVKRRPVKRTRPTARKVIAAATLRRVRRRGWRGGQGGIGGRKCSPTSPMLSR